MLQLTDLSIRRGQRLLLHEANITIHPGWKLGLTGANGCGKSSLFALIRGLLAADEGELKLPDHWVLAHVAQETPAVSSSALDYVLDGDEELRKLQGQLARAEEDNDGHRMGELHARLEHIGAYEAESRAARLLHGLGFKPGQEQRPVQSFSGGWRMRLNLAQALMCRSDLLLLDEPTNHLDLDAVLWLQEWLQAYPGTLLLISHDRDFLDAIVGHIAHIEHQHITLYTGNYSTFEVQRAEKLAGQQAAYEKQQREISHIQSYVDRFRAKATKARQAQSRLKALERMERIAPAHVDSPFHFAFSAAKRHPNPMLSLDEVSLGYDKQAVLEGVNLNIQPGDRIGLLGKNGEGKSTLIRALAGELQPLAGECVEAPALQVGYFAQHQLEQLREDDTPLSHLQRIDPKAGEQQLRDFLGGFGFIGDQALSAIAPFSGGEKARLVLATLAYLRPNLLLLDEPTNHLDLEMRHALTMALQSFEGAMVIVSHDRHLLRTVADTLVLVADGRVRGFDGDLEDYRRMVMEQEREQKRAEPQPGAADNRQSAAERKEQKRREAELRKQLQPLRKQVQQLEQRMDKLQQALGELEQQLLDASIYEESRKGELKDCLERQAALKSELNGVEEQWYEASEMLEQAQLQVSA